MWWPWERRRKLTQRGYPVNAAAIKAMCGMAWPENAIQWDGFGDSEYWVLDEKSRSLLREEAFPDLIRGYKKGIYECEEASRKRLTQADEYAYDWTDLFIPLAFFEIRGREPTGLGHSMNLLVWGPPGQATLEVWQPYNGQEIKPLSWLSNPWLLLA